jgi:hypothetical protein
MTNPADTGTELTRREFALGASGALGALAVGGVAAGAQVDDTRDQTAELGAFDVPAGTKQFTYHSIMNNDAVRLEMPVGVVSGKTEGPTLIVTGGLFATEYSGVEAATRMYRDFDPDAITGRVIISARWTAKASTASFPATPTARRPRYSRTIYSRNSS